MRRTLAVAVVLLVAQAAEPAAARRLDVDPMLGAAFHAVFGWQPASPAVPGPEEPPAAQSGEPAGDADGDAPTMGTPRKPSSPAKPDRISFNFRGATFQQVIEFFSRATGLPVIWQTPAPEGTLDYISPDGYDRAEALRVLNIILQSKGVMLRVSDDMLYLQKLTEMQKQDIPTFVNELPDTVTPDQVVTLVRPMRIALAKPLAEKLSGMVAGYGSVTALEQQNALVLTETAANVRRLLLIVEQLDREDPEGLVEIFPVRHAKAADLLKPLTSLLATRVEKYVINQKGEQVKIEEDRMPGLSISADERTNSLVAKGARNKLDKLRETLQLLDVPAAAGWGAGSGRAVTTMALRTITATQAAEKLNLLYSKLAEKDRPTVIALDDVSKVMILGDDAAVSEGGSLLSELDGGPVASSGTESVVEVVLLSRAQPQQVIAALNGLLTKRQQNVVKLVAGGDGRSIIVAGLAGDVQSVKSLVPVLDRQSAAGRQVRLVRITAADPKKVLDLATALFARQKDADDLGGAAGQLNVSVELDPDGRVVTLVGTQAGVEAFSNTLRMVEANMVVEREARQIKLANTWPSEIIASLQSLAAQLLQPFDGSQFTPPTFAAVDQLNAIIVTATPAQFAVIESLIQSLDTRGSSGAGEPGAGPVPGGQAPPLRILSLRIADAPSIAAMLNAQFSQRTAAERRARPVNVSAEAQTNSLIVAAHSDVLPQIQQLVDELNKTERADLDGREVRIFPLKVARAEALARTVDELFPPPPAPVDARGRPLPQLAKPREVIVRSDPQTNSLIISAPMAAMPLAEELVKRLDQPPTGAGALAMRVFALKHARAAEAGNAVRSAMDARAQAEPGRPRVSITAEPSSNTLIVTASAEQMAQIESVIKPLEELADVGADLPAVKTFVLRFARADQIAPLAQQLLGAYEALARTRPGMAAAAPGPLVRIAADQRLNALLVSAPPALMAVAEQMVSQLDLDPRTVAGGAGGSGLPSVRVLLVQNADATQLAASLEAIFSAPDQASAAGAGGRPIIRVDATSNSLIVRATDEQFKAMEQVVSRIDRASIASTRQMRMIPIDPAKSSAEELARTLQRLLGGGDSGEGAAPVKVMTLEELLQQRQKSSAGRPGGPIAGESRTESPVTGPRAGESAEKEPPSGAGAAGTPDFGPALGTAFHAVFAPPAALLGAVFCTVQETADEAAQVTIAFDKASNSLVILGPQRIVDRLTALARQIQDQLPADPGTIRYVTLPQNVDAQPLATLLNQTIERITPRGAGAKPGDLKARVAIIPDRAGNALIICCNDNDFGTVSDLLAATARPAQGEFPVRTITLQRADAGAVARAVQQFYEDRARVTGARRDGAPAASGAGAAAARRVSIMGIDSSNTLIVSCSDEDFAQVQELVSKFDTPEAAAGLTFRVFELRHARATEIERNVQSLVNDLTWNQGDYVFYWPPRQPETRGRKDTIAVRADARLNALIVTGRGDKFDVVERMIEILDAPAPTGEQKVIRLYRLRHAPLNTVADMVRETFNVNRQRRWWEPPDPSEIKVRTDDSTNVIIVAASAREQDEIQKLITQIDEQMAGDRLETGAVIRTYALKGARADEAVRILTQMLQLDARGATPGPGVPIKIEGSDAPAVEVKARVVADRRSNSLIVTATPPSLAVIESILAKLENVPAASPVEWRIINLQHAQASDVSFTLGQMVRALEADNQPRVRIDYNRLENQLIVAATADQFKQIEQMLGQLDVPPQRERITDFVPLRFAEAQKIQEALSVFYGPWAAEADTPAKRNTRIVADPASNSLVVSAEKQEWEGIRALLAKLDSEEYDASLQLKVIPLSYADAQSVARAINDAFQGTVTGDQRATGRGNQRPRPAASGDDQQRPGGDQNVPTLLVQSENWVRASAEPQTNSIIVSASRQNLQKIEQIVAQLDVADYAKLPPPQIIPITAGDPAQLAQSLTQLYEQGLAGGGPRAAAARKSVRIIGNASSSTIIVRAEKDDFEQIKALAERLQQQVAGQMSVTIIRLKSAPAARVASAITDAFQAKAKQANQAFSIKADASGNSIIVAASGALLEEIKTTVSQLDALQPGSWGAGQGIFIIDLQNITPDTAKSVIESIGLDKPQPADSSSRIVTEPIKVSLLPGAGRNAIVVVANPVDRDTIVALLKAIDTEAGAAGGAAAGGAGGPGLAEASLRVVKLKHAQAAALVQILAQVLRPGDQQAATPLANALKEQVRRLSVQQAAPDGGGPAGGTVDLTRPVRLIADPALNAIIIASTPANVAALEKLIAMFDELPVTDTVTVQIFPLQNISAADFSRILKDLFQQGKQLGRTAITKVQGLPEGAVGKALLEETAITMDERTNAVIVAGTESAVAMVEVLSKRLDSGIVAGWVEPRVIPLRYADATDLAATLQQIIVEGTANLPQSTPIQKQIGRLRMARLNQNGGQVLQSDVFTPMTRLVIRPEPQMNALILVGTPANIEVVRELVAMLDVETAAPGNAVRIYPVENASAARLAQTIRTIFDQQVAAKVLRPEDRVAVQPDERTNSLVVATSPRSFAVLEGLLKSLDSKLDPELREIRTLEVKNASSPRLAGLIQQMMDARLERLRKVQPETADLERALITADPRTNSLIISAGNDTFEVIKRLATDLDVSTLGEASLVQVIPLSPGKGNAERIARTIGQVMERRYADLPAELRSSQRPLVLTDPRSNSLLVAANKADLSAIQDLVAKLADAPQSPAVGIHLIPLGAGARAEVIAPRVQRLMLDRQNFMGTAGTAGDRVSVEADPVSNSLIVAASDESLEVIRNLVDMLLVAESAVGSTGAGGAGREVQIISLSAASRATEIVDMLNHLYVQEANRTRGANTVRVMADERTNSIIISAPGPDVRAIRELVAQLEGGKPAAVVEIKYIPLKSANAFETVNLIENVLSGRGLGPGGRRGARQATVLKYLRQIERQGEGPSGPPAEAPGTPQPGQPDEQAPPAEMEVSAAIRDSITLTPDLRTNTIIVSAPRESMKMIEEMIRDLDASNTGSKSVRIFKLTNADAGAMAQILTDLFNLRQGRNFYVLKPREEAALVPVPMVGAEGVIGAPPSAPPAGGANGEGFAATDLTAVPDERQQLSITVDSRTNSLIVSGTPTYLDLVAQVVDELDRLQANEREVLVYQLRNAAAADVARVVGEFVEQEQRKLVATLSADQLGSASRLLEREITIRGDDKSNSVLVSASPRYMERVKEMIQQLDVDPPQVLIQVMLAEVTLDSRDDWGVDLLARGRIDGATISAGFGLASAFVTGLGVPNLAIASSDFDLLIRAMKAQGRLHVLSNPSIMAANNAPAKIQVGETVRLPISTSITDAGRIQSQLEKEELGVILRVTPSINPDGFVRMTIVPEISNLSQRTTQISEDFQSPIITRRTADTTVTVHDGQTIVLGGLISDRFERRDRKVPFFGELPIIGPLFRSNTEETAKTELLIVLTPHVIDSPAEFGRINMMTNFEIDRLSLPRDVKNQIRRSILEGTGGLYDSSGKRIDVKTEP